MDMIFAYPQFAVSSFYIAVFKTHCDSLFSNISMSVVMYCFVVKATFKAYRQDRI